MSKQTAVEWLAQQIKNNIHHTIKIPLEYFEQAKEMEKKQIIEAHAVGRIKECSGINTDGEHYYDKTFKKNYE
jgi:hypothetical protein